MPLSLPATRSIFTIKRVQNFKEVIVPVQREPTNIIRSAPFVAAEGVDIFIGANDVVMLMPIFKKSACGYWVDATGDYDLCMSEDQLHYRFVSQIPGSTTFMYRFMPGNWFSKRQGHQRPS